MPDTSGLKYDDAIERGIQKAVAHGFIEIVSTAGQRGVRVYTIADRFWLAAGFTTAIKMLADPRLAESPTAWKILAVGEQNPSSSARKILAVGEQNPSSSAREILAVTAPQPAQEEAGDDFKHREKHRENIEEIKRRSGPLTEGRDAIAAQDLDALQQRQVAHHALQKLLAEQEQLRALLPSQRGWGAAQGRLRALARDITRLQAEAAPPATAASPAEPEAAGEADPSEARRSPALRLPQQGNDPPEPAQATPRQRLMQLQGELTHLKKSPSMQLLARQRIPRLEEEIKQLVASLAESA
ncbi:MAG TPA: hypothetical protein VFU32_02095 [Ktedonobacterales bacterium]|nr:hypothetical protein [Ktedonobacterales bacterium]